MGNKIIIKNNLKKLNDEELANKIEREADRKMLWKFQKDRTQKEDPKENAKNDSQ